MRSFFVYRYASSGTTLGICHSRKYAHCHPWPDQGSIVTVIPENYSNVIPNLIGDPVFSFFFFVIFIFCNSWNLQTWIYVIFLSNIRKRNTSWIPAFAGMTIKETIRRLNDALRVTGDGVILESTPTVIPEITPLVIPNLIGNPD